MLMISVGSCNRKALSHNGPKSLPELLAIAPLTHVAFTVRITPTSTVLGSSILRTHCQNVAPASVVNAAPPQSLYAVMEIANASECWAGLNTTFSAFRRFRSCTTRSAPPTNSTVEKLGATNAAAVNGIRAADPAASFDWLNE